MRDPAFVAAIQRESAVMAQHSQNAEIDDWLETVYDFSEWVYDGDFDLPD